jgi:hypothetical protein
MMLSRDALLHSLVRAGAREASRCGWCLASRLLDQLLSYSLVVTATEICLFLSRHVAAAGSMDPGVDLIVHISVGLTIGERKAEMCVTLGRSSGRIPDFRPNCGPTTQ